MYKFKSIGKVLKPYKYQGAFYAAIKAIYFPDLLKCKALFLKINGIEVPFFIVDLDLEENTSIIKVEEFKAPEDVSAFNGMDVYLRTTDITVKEDKKDTLESVTLESYMILDEPTGNEFKILKTMQYPQQMMAVTHFGDREVLIPLAEDWIIDIDPSKKIITMSLPEGLVDL
jgi:16S rRNA processing protein RimM